MPLQEIAVVNRQCARNPIAGETLRPKLFLQRVQSLTGIADLQGLQAHRRWTDKKDNGCLWSERQPTDFVRSIEHLIAREEIDGAVNIASHNPLPNRDFMKALRQAWGAQIGLPAASWMLEIGTLFLRTETELVLKSCRVIPGRLAEAGFQFQSTNGPRSAKSGWTPVCG